MLLKKMCECLYGRGCSKSPVNDASNLFVSLFFESRYAWLKVCYGEMQKALFSKIGTAINRLIEKIVVYATKSINCEVSA